MHTSGSSGSREGGRVKSSVNTSEYLRSREGSRPGSKIENEVSKIMGESIASQNTTGSTLMNDSNIQGHDGLQRERLAGFIVDFDQIPMSVVDRKPMWMGWKQMEAILLRTGRLRTLAQNGRSITDTGT
ncbi:hypothetical protein SERLADRAFT_466100 [Serpula lacrymans var. lacrymans S7.9]|uniref:Uncharacterized protein n=1 Tax=Serpula lacrymans var. lacrymans (strain S7.9) TaxID=578457 RepID=F8NTG5_SERL9|nr:uncharacterized protein SERLADRAFT_466100 [Serpula lacrymans var. lacrymans S7.9]EGO25637.1 hypothetical protein SERLADRAFT_466100 [Serpula lacrymans var. lacrymans S7.9]